MKMILLLFLKKLFQNKKGRIVRLDSVTPSLLAEGISSEYDKDPRIVELLLSESKRIVRMARGIIIVENTSWFCMC